MILRFKMNHQTDLQAHLDSLRAEVVQLQNKIVPGIAKDLEIAIRNEITATRNEICAKHIEIASIRHQRIAQSQGIIIELIFSFPCL